ncbi:PEGA domain-containing protein [Chitinophaga sp. 22321]|uniref:PEGA domain-containing protein n=1 Tax=Chitinophaga hostae TaxID=2831022 RepID=A0ABS5IW40_9BACT|nr:PEGA domain-containing protein [Chitinophaga hostae]MBS0027183.1 PEGA domain-containing protein [Chitinophaga hostae]
MKKQWMLILLLAGAGACKKSSPAPGGNKPDDKIQVAVTAPEAGYIYLDGAYTGIVAPGNIAVTAGKHVLGVALQNSFRYLRKEVNITAGITLQLTTADKPAPKVWKALWIGLNETKGTALTGDCSTHFTKAELDQGYNFFQWSLQQHFEKYAYGTIHWEVTRKDITLPVMLTRGANAMYTVDPATIADMMPEIQPGVYDCVFVFWRESENNCSFKSNYFGLAWTNPMKESIKTGYVTVKFDAGSSLADRINYYKNNDPGVWVHEWLHTVGENFYQDKGLQLPRKAGDGLAVHAAEMYHYIFPWMDWYLDFMSARVPNVYDGPKYLGIGPEAFLGCSVREKATNNCND